MHYGGCLCYILDFGLKKLTEKGRGDARRVVKHTLLLLIPILGEGGLKGGEGPSSPWKRVLMLAYLASKADKVPMATGYQQKYLKDLGRKGG